MSTVAFVPLSKQDVAEVLGVSIRTIENHVVSGRMPAPAHIGARALWHPDVFFAWLDQILRTGGWQDGDEAERADERKVSTAGANATVKREKPSRSRTSVASRLQAKQARLQSTLPSE